MFIIYSELQLGISRELLEKLSGEQLQQLVNEASELLTLFLGQKFQDPAYVASVAQVTSLKLEVEKDLQATAKIAEAEAQPVTTTTLH